MASRKIYTFCENFLPFLLSCILLIGFAYKHLVFIEGGFYFDSISLGKNYKDLLTSILTIVTIFIALLTTVETLIISLSDHNVIARLKKNSKAFNAFIGQLTILTICNVVLVVLCLLFIMNDIKVVEFNLLGIAFCFTIIYSLVAFLWIKFLYFLMIRK